jgi:hypothetical protein
MSDLSYSCLTISAEISTAGIVPLFSGVPRPAVLFSLVWLGAWTVGGAMALTIFAWMLAGREVITVTRDALSV